MKETQLELIEATQDGETESIRVAINQGREALGLKPVSRVLWNWRMANPAGTHLGLARSSDGDLQAAVVGMVQPALLAGESVRFMEVVELFNGSDANAGLARSGLMGELCKSFSAQHGGRAPEGMPVLFGWPTRRAHRYLLSQQKAEVMCSEEFLSAADEQLRHLSKPLAAGLQLQQPSRFPTEVSSFFERYAAEFQCLLVRDEARLNWRFADHPERDYRIAILRREAEIQGYGVWRRADDGAGVLVDWAVPEGQGEVTDALLSWAAELTLESAGKVLLFGASTYSAAYRLFQDRGFVVDDSSEYMLFRGFQKPYIMSWLLQNWHYTFGDLERG